VIDTANGKSVPAETLADVPPPDHPVEYRIDERRPQTAEGKLVAEWRGMTLVVDKDGKLSLLEPGRPKTRVFYRRLPTSRTATFLTPDRILILARVPDRLDCSLCHEHLWVVDKSGELKYKLPVELNPGMFDYYASSHDGTRFVIRDNIEAGRDLALNIITLGGASQFPFNTAVVKIHDAIGGEKLFEYRWRMTEDEEHDSSGRVALSDDGSLLAVIRDETLLVFQLPSRRAP
jgi:hypothetical protein